MSTWNGLIMRYRYRWIVDKGRIVRDHGSWSSWVVVSFITLSFAYNTWLNTLNQKLWWCMQKKMRYHSPFNFLSFRLNDVAEAAHSRFYDYTNIDWANTPSTTFMTTWRENLFKIRWTMSYFFTHTHTHECHEERSQCNMAGKRWLSKNFIYSSLIHIRSLRNPLGGSVIFYGKINDLSSKIYQKKGEWWKKHTQTLIRYISEASQYILRLKLNDGCERVTADDGPGGEKIEEMF